MLDEKKVLEFLHFVASEVIDDEYFELNHGAFSEIACRKLVDLGIMTTEEREDGTYYKYEDPDLYEEENEESEVSIEE